MSEDWKERKMKSALLFVAAAFATAGVAAAQPKPATKPAADMHAGHQMSGPASVKAEGQGVVRGVDPVGGTITIEHAPIPALAWPAMTMKLPVNPPSLARGLSVGQAIKFQLAQTGKDYVVVSIRPN